MRVICYMTGTEREARLRTALLAGFARHGVRADVVRTVDTTGPKPEYDLAVFVGVRTKSMRVLAGARSIGQHTLMLDKGYFDRDRYHRFSVDNPQPTYISEINATPARFQKLHRFAPSYKRLGGERYVVYVESTQKYYTFHNLGAVDDYTESVVARLRPLARDAGLQIIYRPRADQKSTPRTVAGTIRASPHASIHDLYRTAHCVVVHGSNAGVEAMLAGVPVVSLASSAENPIHDLVNKGLGSLRDLIVPDREAVMKRCSQLAWCQFSRDEITSGFAWDHTKQWVR